MEVLAIIGGAIAGLDFAGMLAGYVFGKSIDVVLAKLAKLKKDTWQKQLVHALFLSLNEVHMGSFENSLELHQKSLLIYEKAHRLEHPDTATAYNNIGTCYRAMGNHEKALELHQKALAIREKVHGKEHPDTAQSYNNLGVMHNNMGNHEKALEMHQKALAIREKVLGLEHPDTAMTYGHLGLLYYSLKQYDKALDWNLRAYKAWTHVLGEKHPLTQIAFRNTRSVFAANGRKAKDFAGWLEEQLLQG